MKEVSGGSDAVSVAVFGAIMVVSCVPGWTEQEWDYATAPYGHLNAHLVSFDDGYDADGFEIFMFHIEQEAAA